MYTKDKIEKLQFSIDRFDHYYDSVNNKGNLYLTLNTFLLGGIISGYYALKPVEVLSCVTHFLFWSSLLLNIASILFTLKAIRPYLNKKKEDLSGSLLYFGDISAIALNSFQSRYDSLETEGLYNDMVKQVHLLAIGLRKKFNRLQIATKLIALEFSCLVLIGFNILK